MRATGHGSHDGTRLLGFRSAIPARVINAALALAAATIAEHEDRLCDAEVVLTLARDLVAEARLTTLFETAPASPGAAPALDSDLPTDKAAELLGVSTYTLNEWARLGRIRCRQDSPGGRRYFAPADLAAYEAEHTQAPLTNGPDLRYGSRHDTQRCLELAAQTQTDPTGASRGARGHGNNGRTMGSGPPGRRSSRDARPYAPGAHAWCPPPKEPEG
jgi:hypothetical protein